MSAVGDNGKKKTTTITRTPLHLSSPRLASPSTHQLHPVTSPPIHPFNQPLLSFRPLALSSMVNLTSGLLLPFLCQSPSPSLSPVIDQSSHVTSRLSLCVPLSTLSLVLVSFLPLVLMFSRYPLSFSLSCFFSTPFYSSDSESQVHNCNELHS